MENASVTISSFLSDVPTLVSTAFTMVTSNVVSTVFVGIALAGAGLGLFSRIIHIGRR